MRQLIALFLFASIFPTIARSQAPQKPLSNDDVVGMVSLGLSDDVVIEKIRSAPSTSFDTSIEGLKTLKAAKVSDAVLKIMINPSRAAVSNSGRVMDEMSTKFQRLRNGVVTVWSEFGHGRLHNLQKWHGSDESARGRAVGIPRTSV